MANEDTQFEKMLWDPRGWIAPKGKYVHAEMYGHMEKLSEDNLDDPELSCMLDEWSREKEERKSERLEMTESEGHAEWHSVGHG